MIKSDEDVIPDYKTETDSTYETESVTDNYSLIDDKIKEQESIIEALNKEMLELMRSPSLNMTKRENKRDELKREENKLKQLQKERDFLYHQEQYQPLANTFNPVSKDNKAGKTFGNIVGNNLNSMTTPVYQFISETPYLNILNTSVTIISGLNQVPILNLFAAALILGANFYLLSDARNDLFILMNDAYRICKNYIKILFFINGVYNKLKDLKTDGIDENNKTIINSIINNLIDILIDSELMKRITYILKYLYAFSPHYKSLKGTGASLMRRTAHKISKRFWSGFSRMGAFFNSPIYFRKLSAGLIGLNGDMLVTVTKFNLLFLKLQNIKDYGIELLINEILSDKLFQNVFQDDIREAIQNDSDKTIKYNIKAQILEENKEFMKKEYIEMINVIRKENNIQTEITAGDIDTKISEMEDRLSKDEETYDTVVNSILNESKDTTTTTTTTGGTRKIRKNNKRTKNRRNKKLKKKSRKRSRYGIMII